jgi:hypothetical protein
MDRKPIVSSNITSVGYDEETKTLEVEFFNQKVYQYSPITQEGYSLLMNAESIGSFFARNIKNSPNIVAKEIS